MKKNLQQCWHFFKKPQKDPNYERQKQTKKENSGIGHKVILYTIG
jgi:hypothetical protein